MRLTLLEMVQRILESMESDEVNSYSDTTESSAVANIIKETFDYLTARMDLPRTQTLFQLTASGDNTKPVLMTKPTDVIDIDSVQYSHTSSGKVIWEDVSAMDPEDFLRMQMGLNESETNISTMNLSLDGTDFVMKYYTDRKPKYYTTFEGDQIVFDSYDSTAGDTLQQSRTMCTGSKVPTFTMSDTFVPDLSPRQFQLLLNEAKDQAFIELKQQQNAHASRRAGKMFANIQRTKDNNRKVAGIYSAPRHGRNKP